MISIAIDNGRHNTVGEGCYSAHQAVSKFAEHNIDIWSIELVANARLELVYLGTFIRRLNVSLKLSVSFNRVLV